MKNTTTILINKEQYNTLRSDHVLNSILLFTIIFILILTIMTKYK